MMRGGKGMRMSRFKCAGVVSPYGSYCEDLNITYTQDEEGKQEEI